MTANMRSQLFAMLLVILATMVSQSVAGFFAAVFAYSSLQPICATGVMACYAAGGATWGATLAATAPPTIVACNAAFGACQGAAFKVSGVAAALPLP